LFVLVQLGHDVQLVARSSHEDVDVSLVARELGGGGHSRAAAALVIDTTIEEVARRIKRYLPQIVKPMGRVADIMSLGVNTIGPNITVTEAAKLMRRSGHEGYPVVEPDSGLIMGLLTRHAVDRAASHELGYLPVSRIMEAGSFSVRPSASIERVQELMLSEGWGQIPVVAEESTPAQMDHDPIGIVTRTDLLNYWFRPIAETDDTEMRSLLAESLAPPMWALVQAISELAAALGMPLYFVGGLVRDLLLQKTAVDLDMVVEGNAIELVQQLQEQFGGEIHTHSRFGTAKWFLEPQIWQAAVNRFGTQRLDQDPSRQVFEFLPESIDFVTARTEFYNEPSALPEVERGSIKLDLHRRDFTINTLAIRLDGAHLGELLDFYGGQRDLERGVIRVLHSLSFVDDPTRILRAVRLEQRLAFNIEERTLEHLSAALPMLSRVTGDRIRHEIELGMREAEPVKVLKRLSELDVLEHIHRGLTFTPKAAHYLYRVPIFIHDPLWQDALPQGSLEFIYFALWLVPLPRDIQKQTVERLRGRKATVEDVLAVHRLLRALRELTEDPLPSQVAATCRSFRSRVLFAARIVLEDDPLGDLLDRYYDEWRFVKSSLRGEDLLALGLTPGPSFAHYLDQLLAARLDGLVEDEAGERLLLAQLIANSES
jgi:tRNA nucleotidyltransferase (CCA-adding enzyme)